ncbi:MAG: hypothetical protein CL534_09425 [Ahrensia sp.]|nr:hypothetical protein [Ahrensia sp.]
MKNIGITLLIFNCLGLAGCAGGNAIDEAVPQAAFGDADAPVPPARPGAEAAAATAPEPAPDPLFSSSGQAALNGAYPNINNEPRGAAPQMTDAGRDALLAKMQALAAARSQGLVSAAEYQRRLAELRTIGATHSDATIKIIEN